VEFLISIIDLFLHLDDHLHKIILEYGTWTYAILFLIIFAETGLVVAPFLPGDSLLFVAGTFAASGSLEIGWLLSLLIIAAILGDALNYAIGKKIGTSVFDKPSRFFKRRYLDKTHQFYEKYGGKTIVIARFVPIIRTFAPFLAGVGNMGYFRFFSYNVIGAILWVLLCTLTGYFFGNLPIVKDNFGLVIIAIIVISVLPALIEVIKLRSQKLSNQPNKN